MKKLVLMVTLAVLLLGCSTGPPSVHLGSATASTETSDGGSGEPEQRLSFFCRSLDTSPDVQLSSLEEVWAATNYLRMESCQVSYIGPQPFQPTAAEAAAIESARSVDPDAPGGLDAYLAAVGLCTRVSDETAPGGFAESRKEIMRTAARICPEGPQGKIIRAWADGSRVADGRHVVGGSMEPGKFALVKSSETPEAEECTWIIADADGRVLDQKSSPTAPNEVTLKTGEVFTSDKCGIWGKID